ncbi:TonB-dependent receptor [Gluconacetobacter diazotrophicus PA1 5]|uniref:TonB-dependent receptor plug domain-containing protein n=1 Tax=Gluconacetobacter diazotrophicus TaxID=33996 RepID=UPI000173C0C0|nr:TonB-dependent receptor [Gluconacetobacter diazotrophicus]ACI52073.1 TonB-dependent receptor [Gluconacetobacter diazotrophicus PA1 5]TWB03055.1 iron complex outermembrane receptor protein [Gluconacetobacter diazotrophicus]
MMRSGFFPRNAAAARGPVAVYSDHAITLMAALLLSVAPVKGFGATTEAGPDASSKPTSKTPSKSTAGKAVRGVAVPPGKTAGASSGLAHVGAGEEIVATGAADRISPAFRVATLTNSTVRVAVVTAAQLLQTGQTNVISALQMTSPEINAPPGGGGGAYSTTPTQTVILRNLNADETLVLVNGVRRHISALGNWGDGPAEGTEPADLSLIPLSAIDHVEIITEGATALYGQDALGGAVNIVLKSGARNGGTANLMNSGYYRGDGQAIEGYGDIERTIGHRGGGIDIAWQVLNQLPTHRDGLNTATLYGPQDAALQQKVGQDVNRVEGLSKSLAEVFSFNGHVPVTDRVDAYLTGTLGHRTTDRVGFPRGPANNNNVRAIYPNGFAPIETFDELDFQVNGGLRGVLPLGVSWNTYSSFGREQVNEDVENDLNPTFGAQSQTNFHQGTIVASELIGGAKFSKEFRSAALPKPAVLDFGLEYRHDTYQLGQGDYQSWATGPVLIGQTGVQPSSGAVGYAGFEPVNAGNWSRDIFDGHVGLDIFVTKKWEWTIGGRAVSYSDLGAAPTGSIGTRYNFSRRFALRANVNTGYRAPTLGAVHYNATSTGPGEVTENLSDFDPTARLLGATGVKGESSRSYNIGFDWTPLDSLHLSLDGYRIDINDRIESTTEFSGPLMNQFLYSQGITSSPTDKIYVTYMTNIGNTTTNGFTGKISYQFPVDPSWGKLVGTVMANAADTEVTHYASTPAILGQLGQTYFDSLSRNNLLRASPKNKESFALDWSRGRYSVYVQEQRYAGVEWINYSGDPASTWTHIRPQVQTNVEFSARVGRGFTLTVGANNLFNKYPTHVKRSTVAETQGTIAYPMTAPGGYEGGYYYARVGYVF